jgi:glycosyltransferase involved in cell wall biosynthesis
LTTQKVSSTATGAPIVTFQMRVSVVDPAAYTPPYDRALCAALAQAGADVELVTAPFPHGEVPPARGYTVREDFYRFAPKGRGRRWARLAQHIPDMLRASRREADVVHFQWLAVQPLDQHLLRAYSRPRVITAHDVLPRAPMPGQLDAQRALYERMDAVVVHTDHGRARLVDELGVPEPRVHVIPHGILRPAGDAPLPPELPEYDGTVVLCFGLLRPYKGLDVLVEAWQDIEHAELWIVGAPRMDVAPLHAAAPPSVRFVERFVSEGEAAALFRRADLAVLPYREIEQSGVLFTALGFGVPLVLTDVGGFPEVAAAGAAELVAPGDAAALHEALAGLLAEPSRLAMLAMGSLRLADEVHGWDAIARAHLDLYDALVR